VCLEELYIVVLCSKGTSQAGQAGRCSTKKCTVSLSLEKAAKVIYFLGNTC
jgi:hypothetical protein